jgi:hypothetical protein
MNILLPKSRNSGDIELLCFGLINIPFEVLGLSKPCRCEAAFTNLMLSNLKILAKTKVVSGDSQCLNTWFNSIRNSHYTLNIRNRQTRKWMLNASHL